MPLIDFRKLIKVYYVKVRCTNCGELQDLRIPKGKQINEYIKSEGAVCQVCQCQTLRRLREEQDDDREDD